MKERNFEDFLNYASGFRGFFFQLGESDRRTSVFFLFSFIFKGLDGAFFVFFLDIVRGSFFLFFFSGFWLLELLGMGAVGGGGFIAKKGAKVDSFSFVSWNKGCEEFTSPSHPVLTSHSFLVFFTPPHSFISSGGTFSPSFPFFFLLVS